MCDASWIAQAARLQDFKADGGWAWKLLAVRDIVDWAANDLPRHFSFTQMIWGKKKIVNHQGHPVFSILREIKEQRSAFLSQYILHGYDLGLDEDNSELKAFVFASSFLNKFLEGRWGDVHWWDDFVQPTEDVYSMIAGGTSHSGDIYLTRERLLLMREKLMRRERVMSVTKRGPDDDYSMASLLDEFAKMLLNATRLGCNNSFSEQYLSDIQELFNQVMKAAGPHLTRTLRSDDYHDERADIFLVESEIHIVASFDNINNSVETFRAMHQMAPGTLKKLSILNDIGEDDLQWLVRKSSGGSGENAGKPTPPPLPSSTDALAAHSEGYTRTRHELHAQLMPLVVQSDRGRVERG